MCMCSENNPQIIYQFLCVLNLIIFQAQILSMCIRSRYLVWFALKYLVDLVNFGGFLKGLIDCVGV